MYFFRADGSAVTGAGHLMRCLTIADELNKVIAMTDRLCFLCADEEAAQMITDRGYEVIVLHTDYRCMDQELPVLRQLFLEGRFSKDIFTVGTAGQKAETVFVVDSYYVTNTYLQALKAFGKVVVLDDLCHQAFDADAVINYNAFARESDYRQLYRESMTRCYIGSSYVPVRPQFLQVPYVVRDTVEDILITTGGGDSENIAAQILKTIWNPAWRYHLVIGRFNPYFTFWKQCEEQFPQIRLYHDVKNMAELMRQCDVAVTAGGTTIYELAAIGVPFLCFSYAENQEALTEYLGKHEIAGYCGAYHLDKESTLQRIKEKMQETAADVRLRKSMSEKERMMIDGKGAGRLAAILSAQREEFKCAERNQK